MQVDVRLIAATNQDLKKLIVEGKFREDLFYRLNVISIVLPTLAERKEDIHELSLHFLKRTSQRLGKPLSQIDDDALDALKLYYWPGNIRELENVIERAVVLADRGSITLRDLPREVFERRMPTPKGSVSRPSVDPRSLRGTIREVVEEPAMVSANVLASGGLDETAERRALEDALRSANGNKAEAARFLGIPRSTLFSKLRKYRINKPR